MGIKKAEKMTVQQRVDGLKNKAKTLHDGALHVSDDLVDVSLKTGAKWQKIMAKALNEGTGLFEKQQDLVLSTLEELKDQYMHGNKRFRKLVGLNKPQSKKLTRREKNLKASAAEIDKTVTKLEKEMAISTSDVAKDDLKIIEGIGPKIESLLNNAGILTIHRLAASSVKDLKRILDSAGPGYKAHNPVTWIEQAKLEAAGKLEKQSK